MVDRVPGQPRIVVGVDLSHDSLAALCWAAGEAQLRRTELQVVFACDPRGGRLAPSGLAGRRAGHCERRAQSAARLADAVRTVLGPAPPVPVTVEVIEGLAARVLLDRAAGAELLVLGPAVGAGQDVIGPVARACLRHPPCPVVVASHDPASQPLPV